MKKLLFIVAVLLMVGWPSNALAATEPLLDENQLEAVGFRDYESLNPNSLLFQFKRIGEQINGKLISDTEKKRQFERNLFDKRFRELVYIINSQKTGFLVETVERYNSSAGRLKLIVPNENLKAQTEKYLKVLERLRDQYHSNSAHWLSIQQTIDVTRSLE